MVASEASVQLGLPYAQHCVKQSPFEVKQDAACESQTRCVDHRTKGHDIFVCDEESQFYSQCLEKMLVKNSNSSQTVIEFGSGDGSPILACLQNSQFAGTIHGYELNPKAAAIARNKAEETQLSQHYVVCTCLAQACCRNVKNMHEMLLIYPQLSHVQKRKACDACYVLPRCCCTLIAYMHSQQYFISVPNACQDFKT